MPEEYYFLFDPDEIDTSNIDREGWRRSAPARNLMEHRRWDRLEDRHFQRIIARQQGYVAYMDWMLGQCLGRLEELGLLDTILFAFYTDHGVMTGKNGTFLKTDFDDRASRIECVLRHPGFVPAGQDYKGPASALDFFPTVAGLMGFPSLEGVVGEDLAPAIRARDPSLGRRHAHSWMGVRKRNWITRSAMITDGRYKYQRHADTLPGGGPYRLLYDLEADPDEAVDLAGDPAHARRVADFEALIDAELASYAEPPIEPRPR